MAVTTIISKCVMQTWLSKTFAYQISLTKCSQLSWQTRHKHLTTQTSYFQLFKTSSESTKRLLSTEGPSDSNNDTPVPDDVTRISKVKDKKGLAVKVLESVGRFIPHDILDLTGTDGQEHVGITRKEAMLRSKQSDLKLVLVNAKSKPNPTYRLMSGAELHHERMKAKETHEKEKKPTETKEVTISENIGQHDLEIKKKQIQNWMESSDHQYHVRITVRHKKRSSAGTQTTIDDKMKLVNGILDGLNDITINGPPKKFGQNGESIRVTLRHMSAKEKIKHSKENQ